jgi:CubicO group peptidase (beta-lactamase class C family)
VLPIRAPADFLPLFADRPPYGPPGGGFHYSNAGFVLLGLIVEEVSGLSFVDAVRRQVFEPAGMAASGFFRLDEPVPDLAVGYLPSGRSNVYSIPVIGGADGGAQCTAADLDRFLRRWDDGSLLGDRRDVMLTPHAAVDAGIDYGYGCFLYGDGRFGHGGGDPGVTTLVQRIPSADATVVVLLNIEGPAGAARDLRRGVCTRVASGPAQDLATGASSRPTHHSDAGTRPAAVSAARFGPSRRAVTTTTSVAPRSLAITRTAASSSTPTRGHSCRSSTAKSTTRHAGPRSNTGGAASRVPNA